MKRIAAVHINSNLILAPEIWRAYTALSADFVIVLNVYPKLISTDNGRLIGMEETVEKSCWNITVWAVAAVLGIAIVGSFVSGSRQAAEIGEGAPAVQAASNVSG